jgi:hypothetical protein
VNAADDTHESRRCPGCGVVLPVSEWPGGTSSGYHVGPRTRPITTIFALNGLYMYFERGSGNLDVRTAHGIMANKYSDWPDQDRELVGDLTVQLVPERYFHR